MHYTKEDLINLNREHDALIGVDSDGCVFDSMYEKQINFFLPNIVKMWGLEKIEPQVRSLIKYVGLFSKNRGRHRFISLSILFDLLPSMPGVAESGLCLPSAKELKEYCSSGVMLGNDSLALWLKNHKSEELERVLEWSLTLNKDIASSDRIIPPFDGVSTILEHMSNVADVIVVSQTPEEAIYREWQKADILKFVKAIGSMDNGKKSDHLKLASSGHYKNEKIILLGDAYGDMEAAREADVCFYPIMPGKEVESWRNFKNIYLPLFLKGFYKKEAEEKLINEFVLALENAKIEFSE